MRFHPSLANAHSDKALLALSPHDPTRTDSSGYSDYSCSFLSYFLLTDDTRCQYVEVDVVTSECRSLVPTTCRRSRSHESYTGISVCCANVHRSAWYMEGIHLHKVVPTSQGVHWAVELDPLDILLFFSRGLSLLTYTIQGPALYLFTVSITRRVIANKGLKFYSHFTNVSRIPHECGITHLSISYPLSGTVSLYSKRLSHLEFILRII